MKIRDEIKKALIVFEATLKFAKPVTSELIDLWAILLERAGCEAEDIEPSAHLWVTREKEFPSPSEIIKLCLNRKHDREFELRARQTVYELPEQQKALP